MAVIVIAQRDPQAVKRCLCQNCASVLEYTRSDTQKRSHRDYTGCTDTWRVIVCPTCSADVRVTA